MDSVVVVLDATKDPYSLNVNITITGNLEARNIPVLIVANKVLKKASILKLLSGFPTNIKYWAYQQIW